MKKQEKKQTVETSGPLLFLTVSGMGLCNAKGRIAVSYGWKRRIGDVHKPMSTLFVPLLEEASNLCRWQSDGDMIADLELLAKWATQTLDGERKELARKNKAR